MKLHATALLLACLTGCASTTPTSTPTEPGAVGDAMRFSGKVEDINNGCFSDGVCSVTVSGTKVITMMGWSRDTWGQRDPELRSDDTADVFCKRTQDGCTLNGSADYYVRKKP